MKKALIQLHLAVFLAGFTAVLGKFIGLNEIVLVWYRILLSIITIAIIAFYKEKIHKITLDELKKIAVVGSLIALHWVAFYGSVKYANVSVAVVCLAGSGFFSSFLEPIIYKSKIKWVEVFLGLMAIAGICIIFNFHPQFKVGIYFGIVAAVTSALFTIYNKQLVYKHSSTTLTFYELVTGFIAISILMPFYLMYFPTSYYLPTYSDWAWLLVLAWLCTVLCFKLQLNALKKLSSFTLILAYNLEPVYGIILGFIVFKENKFLNNEFYFGVLLIILAVVLQTARILKIHPIKRQ